MLHDTNVRESDFGVWRLWDELSRTYPGFAFPHGHGLGVLAVGRDVDADFLDFLVAAERDSLAARFFAALGSRIAAPARERRARAAVEHEAQRRIQAAHDARAAAELEARRKVDAANEARAALDALHLETMTFDAELAAETALYVRKGISLGDRCFLAAADKVGAGWTSDRELGALFKDLAPRLHFFR